MEREGGFVGIEKSRKEKKRLAERSFEYRFTLGKKRQRTDYACEECGHCLEK